MSNCTSGFPTLFHIDVVVSGRTVASLDFKRSRQILIPGINFTCNGSITRWIFGTRWEGYGDAHIELQIWRRNTDNQYMKVNGTSVIVGAENDSRVYEYELETPLAFQEGDILGYFQPGNMAATTQLSLFVDNVDRMAAHRTALGNDSVPPPNGAVFNSITNINTRYPLIAVRTGAVTVTLYRSQLIPYQQILQTVCVVSCQRRECMHCLTYHHSMQGRE